MYAAFDSRTGKRMGRPYKTPEAAQRWIARSHSLTKQFYVVKEVAE